MTGPPPHPRPPLAAHRPHAVIAPFGTRSDPFYWLRDDRRAEPQVLAHLEAENAYAEAELTRLAPLREALYTEIRDRVPQEDASVPSRRNGWWYYRRYATGQEYPVYVRRRDRHGGPEQLLLDANHAARGHDFYQAGSLEVSPDNRLLAWAEDTVGRREFVVRIRSLDSGEELPEVLSGVESDLAWANDSQTLLYVEKHPQTLLGYRVKKHRLGTPVAADELVYEQDDESFYTGVVKSKSERFIYIVAQSTISTEYRYADAADPALSFRVALPREPDHEYQLEDQGDRFIIRSNWRARNFRIVAAPITAVADRSVWQDLVPHRAEVLLGGFEVFRDYLAVVERAAAVTRIRVRSWDGQRNFVLDADEPAFTMALGANDEIDSDTLRYVYSSLTTPNTTYDYDMTSGLRQQLKQESVLGDFDPANYRTELVWAAARDGARVPVSLLYRREFRRDATAPLYQYAYGAYGLSTDAAFRPEALSLVDRGFVYALAHVRGGQELGRDWYDQGRLRAKRNSFTDFIDVTRQLVRERYCDAAQVFGMGGSAGGLLIAAVANLAPSDYRGLIAHVPFVDVVTTMLDDSIPLTTNEYDEWGNPAADADAYAYMLSYSPYDNVQAQDYPALLVTSGLWDSQVQYWEPAKWVARLRLLKTDRNPLLLHTHLEAGHGGRSGRFQHYREIAEEYAFVLGLAAEAHHR